MSLLGWHGWWQASLQLQSSPFCGCLPYRKRIRGHSTDPIGPQTQQAQHSQYSEDRGNAISTFGCCDPSRSVCKGAHARRKFFAALVRSGPFWQECWGSRHPANLVIKSALVSEAFCVAFQMSVEVNGKVRRRSTQEFSLLYWSQLLKVLCESKFQQALCVWACTEGQREGQRHASLPAICLPSRLLKLMA